MNLNYWQTIVIGMLREFEFLLSSIRSNELQVGIFVIFAQINERNSCWVYVLDVLLDPENTKKDVFTLIESLIELVVVRDRYMAMTVQCHMGYKRICKSLGNRDWLDFVQNSN